MMLVNTDALVPMTDANQNFSRVARMVEENGMAVILKNNKPRYIVIDFAEYEDVVRLREARKKLVSDTADTLIEENRTALEELAK